MAICLIFELKNNILNFFCDKAENIPVSHAGNKFLIWVCNDK
jgi:hypothetical protein